MEYIVINGEVKELISHTVVVNGKTTNVKLKSGLQINGINSTYICDKNGKSFKDGKFYNYKEWERKYGICECCGRQTDWNEINGIFVNRIF